MLKLAHLRSLEFYHNLLQRKELDEIFLKYSVTHAGLAMTTGELKRFLQTEQARCARAMPSVSVVQNSDILTARGGRDGRGLQIGRRRV